MVTTLQFGGGGGGQDSAGAEQYTHEYLRLVHLRFTAATFWLKKAQPQLVLFTLHESGRLEVISILNPGLGTGVQKTYNFLFPAFCMV